LGVFTICVSCQECEILRFAMASNSLTYGGQEKTPSLSGGDTDFASEVNPGGLFHADYKRHDDLKQMLDSSKDSLKLEAMKRIIGVKL